jgi:hypothetical protein
MTVYTTATAQIGEPGPLKRQVDGFVAAQAKVLASGPKTPEDWAPMGEYLDIANFKRVGAYLEELDFQDYCEFMTGWSAGGTQFEFTEFYFTEVGNAAFQEIEERHTRGDQFVRKNVIAVYRFNADNKIVHLDIYEQAKDSGDWIRESARAAMEGA